MGWRGSSGLRPDKKTLKSFSIQHKIMNYIKKFLEIILKSFWIQNKILTIEKKIEKRLTIESRENSPFVKYMKNHNSLSVSEMS